MSDGEWDRVPMERATSEDPRRGSGARGRMAHAARVQREARE